MGDIVLGIVGGIFLLIALVIEWVVGSCHKKGIYRIGGFLGTMPVSAYLGKNPKAKRIYEEVSACGGSRVEEAVLEKLFSLGVTAVAPANGGADVIVAYDRGILVRGKTGSSKGREGQLFVNNGIRKFASLMTEQNGCTVFQYLGGGNTFALEKVYLAPEACEKIGEKLPSLTSGEMILAASGWEAEEKKERQHRRIEK